MIELSSQAAIAGSKVAIEWSRLEALGFNPASVCRKPVDQLAEVELPYLRAYQHFEFIVSQCREKGVRIPLRYATFHAAGGASNPGVLPPTVPLLALVLLLSTLTLICLRVIDLGAISFPMTAVSAGVVVLGWDRVWAFGEYLSVLRQKRVSRRSS